jgi:predicted  nucleic acid-binding Zn-ribbon protein
MGFRKPGHEISAKGALMLKKNDKKTDVQREILDGVDAVGTIVEEDLGYVRKRMSELQKSLEDIKDEMVSLKTEHRILENNQQDIIETLKYLVDKLNHIEIRVTGNAESKVDQMD